MHTNAQHVAKSYHISSDDFDLIEIEFGNVWRHRQYLKQVFCLRTLGMLLFHKTICSSGRDFSNSNGRTDYLAQASHADAISANISRGSGFVWSGLDRLRILKKLSRLVHEVVMNFDAVVCVASGESLLHVLNVRISQSECDWYSPVI